MNIKRAASRCVAVFAAALGCCSSSVAQTTDGKESAFKLSQCGELSLQLSEGASSPTLKEQRAAAALRYLLPLEDLMPLETERKAIVEAAARSLEEQAKKLRDSKRVLPDAYEWVRLLFGECNQIRARLEAARPQAPSGSTQ